MILMNQMIEAYSKPKDEPIKSYRESMNGHNEYMKPVIGQVHQSSGPHGFIQSTSKHGSPPIYGDKHDSVEPSSQ